MALEITEKDLVKGLVNSTSFSTLNPEGQDIVLNYFQSVHLGEKRLEIAHLELFRNQKSLAILLDDYGDQLDNIDPASFDFMDEGQKIALCQRLLFAYFIFSAQCQLDRSQNRRQVLADRYRQINICAKHIDQLRLRLGNNDPLQTQFKQITHESEQYLKYLGWTTVAPYMIDKMLTICGDKKITHLEGAGKTGFTIKWMSDVNGLRLYWVWGGGLLSSVMTLLPDNFANKQQTVQALATPAPFTGYMSWLLYYTRFAINLGLLLKHTIAGSWMSESEKKVPAWERFKTQWNMRKFALLNDSIWATANLACFFWLIGTGLLGYMGNVVTALLLLMDTCLTIWRFWEMSTQHNKDMARYINDIEKLEHDIASFEAKFLREKETSQCELDYLMTLMIKSNEDISKMRNKIAEQTLDHEKKSKLMQLQLAALIKSKQQYELNWRYKKYGLINDVVYAVGLMSAFCIASSCFLPAVMLAPGAALLLGLVGAALCFTLTAAYAAVGNGIEIAKSKHAKHLAEQEYQLQIEQFKKCPDPAVKKQLFLEIQRLKGDMAYQAKLIHFQQMKLLRAVMIDAMIPPLVFMTFMFMPWQIAIPVLIAGLALALITSYIHNRYAPKKDDFRKRGLEKYNEFEGDMKKTDSIFFAPSHKKLSKNDERYDDKRRPGLVNGHLAEE